jgi:hypothetical protein
LAFPDPQEILCRLAAWPLEVRRHEKIAEEEVLVDALTEKPRMLQENESGSEATTIDTGAATDTAERPENGPSKPVGPSYAAVEIVGTSSSGISVIVGTTAEIATAEGTAGGAGA